MQGRGPFCLIHYIFNHCHLPRERKICSGYDLTFGLQYFKWFEQNERTCWEVCLMDVRLLWTIARTENSFWDTAHNKYCMGDLSFMEKHSADKKTLILPLIDVQDLQNRSSGSSKWCFASLNLCFRAQDLLWRALIPLLCTENPCCFITASVKLARSLNGAGRISAFELCSPLMRVLMAPFLDFPDGTGSLDLILTAPLAIEVVHWTVAVPFL